MPTKSKTGLCPDCGLECSLTRNKLHPHPAKDRPSRGAGSKALCPGGGKHATTAPAAAPDDASPADPQFLEPTLSQALLEHDRPAGAWAGAEAISVDPRLIDPDPANPRGELGDLTEMAASLIADGMLEPVLVAPGATKGRFALVAGHRRVAGAILAGLPEVPALLRRDLVAGSNLSLTAQIVENFHREPLLPIEEARAFQRLRDLGMKQTDIATSVGCNQGQVSKRLALLKLPPELADRVGAEGGIDVHAAAELAKLPTPAAERAIADITRGQNPRQAVSSARAHHERTTAHDQVVSDLEQAGVALVDFPAGWFWSSAREDRPLLTGSDGLEQPYGGARTIPETWQAHHALPCHGAAISPNHEVIYVCLDPTLHGHPSVEAEQEQAAKASRKVAEEAEAAKALEAASYEARTAGSRSAALAKVSKADMATAVAAWACISLTGDELYGTLPTFETVPVVLDWLGLDPDPGEDTIADVATLVSAEGELRVAYMASLAAGDMVVREALQSPYLRQMLQGHAGIRHHLQTLEAAGYVLTDVDQALMVIPEPLEPEVVPAADEDLPDVDGAPEGTVAWYSPTPAARAMGDEPRWVAQDEADALAPVDDRLVFLHHLTDPSAVDGVTVPDDTEVPA